MTFAIADTHHTAHNGASTGEHDMHDRNEYHQHQPCRRQHYAQSNAPKQPVIPTWVALLVIVVCIGLAGAIGV